MPSRAARVAIFHLFLTFAWIQPVSATLTGTEQTHMLGQHNTVRAGVVPPAANMPALAWDNALQTVAQRYADQCVWGHNPNRNNEYAAVSGNGGGVGENIFITTGSRTAALGSDAATGAVGLWAAEAAFYDLATNTCAPGQVCGHYTQIVWANTLRVGCGIRQCPTVTNLPGFNNAHLVVCNYNPAGNFFGQPPYTAAPVATAPTHSVPLMPAPAMAALAALLVALGCGVQRATRHR